MRRELSDFLVGYGFGLGSDLLFQNDPTVTDAVMSSALVFGVIGGISKFNKASTEDAVKRGALYGAGYFAGELTYMVGKYFM